MLMLKLDNLIETFFYAFHFRRRFVKLLQHVLLDPLLDEKPLVVQAVQTLHSQASDEYDDIIMEIFQEIFDPKSDLNNQTSHVMEGDEHGEGADDDDMMADDIEVNRAAEMEGEEMLQTSNIEEPPQGVQPKPMSQYQLTKLREQVHISY